MTPPKQQQSSDELNDLINEGTTSTLTSSSN